MTRLVRVTPIWAPESCVDSVRSACRTPDGLRVALAAAFSTADRSTATKEYSAAPKTPHASTRPTEIASSSHSMRPLWRVGRAAANGRSAGDHDLVRPETQARGSVRWFSQSTTRG